MKKGTENTGDSHIEGDFYSTKTFEKIKSAFPNEKALEEMLGNYEKYKLITEHTTELITLIDGEGRFQFVSPSFENLLGYELSVIENTYLFDLIHPDDLEYVKKDINKYCKKGRELVTTEFRLQNDTGEYIDVEGKISVVENQENLGNELIILVMRDIRGRKIVEQQIYHLAYHDSLTNLPNRRSFMTHFQSESRYSNRAKKKLSILFIDLDNFKFINDQWGHDVGDLVLKESAKNIKEAIRQKDIVARFGGDEFIVMLKDVQDEQEIVTYVNQILMKFQEPFLVSGREYMITVSIGVAIYPEHGLTSDELIKNADTALHYIKERGKNSFKFFDKEIQDESLERRLLENALRNAIKNQQFYLEYQPKINLETNEIFGMEALVRWKHPDLGIISPGKFIPLAEETGLIIPLGEWILQESMNQTKKWQDEGIQNLVVSVNVSVRQLEDGNFIERVQKLLNETKLNPKWLEFEVTESVFADVRNAAEILREIRDLGIQISVDDFGTGYSSLSYIKYLPIDTLKVDASFIKDVHTNEESKAIVKAVLTLANTIGLNVIAEGIEIQEHVKELSEDGLLFGQGFYFSRPLKGKDFKSYIEESMEKI